MSGTARPTKELMSTASATNDTPPSYPEGLPDSVAPLPRDAVASGARVLFAVMLATGLMLVVGVLTDAKQFFHSYLFGYVFALDIALGALFWVLIHHVSDAGWSV